LVGPLALGRDPLQVLGIHQPVPQLGVADAVGSRHAHQRLDLRAHIEDRIRCLRAERIHHTGEAFQQRLQARLNIDQAPLQLAAGRHLGPQLDLGHDQPSQVGEESHLIRGPVPRAVIGHAHRAQDIPRGVDQWDAEIGRQAKLPDQRVVPGQGITTSIADRQRLAGHHHMLTQRMRQRRLPGRCPRLGQPHACLDELAVVLDQRHQGDGDLQQAGGHPGHPIKGVLGRGVEQVGLAHRGQPTRVSQHAGQPGSHTGRPPSTNAGHLLDPATAALTTKPAYRLIASNRNRQF
jgi:hypothetical protein